MFFENHLPIVQAVEKATGKRPHIQTVRRWIKKGVRGIRLEASFVNGQYLTSTSAVKEYIAATTEARLQVTEAPKIDIPKPVKLKPGSLRGWDERIIWFCPHRSDQKYRCDL